jgi:signal transduction histidine kinase
MKPASLSARITTLLVVTSLLVLGGGARLMDWRVDHELESRFRQNLLTQASALSTMIQLEQDEAPGDQRQHPHAGLLGGDSPTFYEVRCEGAPPLHSTPSPPVSPPEWARQTDSQPRFADLRRADQQLGSVRFAFTLAPDEHNDKSASRSAPIFQGNRACALLFEQDRSTTNEILLAIDWILLLSPALALGIALIAVPLIVRRGLRPMTVLVDRMHDIGPNAPGQRLAASGMRELDPLVARFNDVLGRMDEGLARERQFASGLAHETRTRLAELRALTGAELEATVTALLLLTRLQSGLEQPQPEALPLAAWLERQLQRQQGLAAGREVTLQLAGTPPAGLRTDPALLEVVVGNLLGNACAYAPAGDTVTMHLTANGLDIDNAAPELDVDDLPNFGQRFWRKQLPHAGHAGLGLALANAAAGALGLQLAFRLDAGQRLHAMLSWPNQMTHRITRS